MNRAQAGAFAAAVLLHAGLLLFGGALFMHRNDEAAPARDVDLVSGDPAAEEPEKKPDEDEKKKEEAQEEDEPEQDPEAVSETREAAPDTSQLNALESQAPAALAPLSLSDLSSALGGAPALDSGFDTGGGLSSGGRIGGTGTRLATDDGEDGGAGALFAIGELDQRPRAILQTPPAYPPDLRQRKVEGTVEVVFLVDTNGRVTSPHVEKSTNPAFERPALDAVRGWRFEAGTRGGEKVSFKMKVPITFRAGQERS